MNFKASSMKLQDILVTNHAIERWTQEMSMDSHYWSADDQDRLPLGPVERQDGEQAL